MVIMEDIHHPFATEGILSEISEIDEITDSEPIHDVKISDFMETTDYFETTDNETLCDSENPDRNEGPKNKIFYNKESNAASTDDSSEAPEEKSTYDSEKADNDSLGDYQQGTNIQESSDSDNGDEGSDDEDNDGNEGDSEGSDDDGNEGDNEGSDDDDRDIKYYKNGAEVFDKTLENSTNQDVYEEEVEIISEESMQEEEEEAPEEGELDPSPSLSLLRMPRLLWATSGEVNRMYVLYTQRIEQLISPQDVEKERGELEKGGI